MMTNNHRVLLIVTPRSYRVPSFMAAAKQLGIEVVQAIDMPEQLASYWDVTLGVDFHDLATATQRIVAFAAKRPFAAIIAVDDTGSLLAARASEALGLRHNSLAAAEAARDKYKMRQMLQASGLLCPRFRRFALDTDPQQVVQQVIDDVLFPCVVKPLRVSGSRGVIRADNPAQLVSAITRLRRILAQQDPQAVSFLVEAFIPGFEVALEGMITDGRLQILALFDKPDPLNGPFFEETIYVTPSRLPIDTQQAIAACTAQAAQALGLRGGPLHAELRLNDEGPWLVELAGRSIGGLCSQTLRFGTDASLEELILRQACGLEIASTQQAAQAGGVMMIPIPEAGLLKEVTGCAEAEAVPLIEQVEITAKLHYPLVPLPEGDSYLGFIFARGETAVAVETALRQAHSKLHFEITPQIPLLPINF